MLFRTCFVYIDDVIVFGATEAECIANTRQVVALIYGDGLKLGCLKCEFLLRTVDVLGHIISGGCLYAKCDKL